MAGPTGPSTKERSTRSVKGKGKSKRPAAGNTSDGGAGNGDGDNDGDIVRITKRQATGRKSASGSMGPDVSTEGLPAGLVIIPPSPISHSDDESAHSGVLRATGTSVPAIRQRRKDKRAPLATGSETAAKLLGQMLKLQEESEAADLDHQAALDQMESLKKMLDNEVERWYGKYRAKMVALSEMSETLQEVRAGREIARERAKIWEVKKERIEVEAANSSNLEEQLAAANERVRVLEIESQKAIAQLGENVELKEKLEESLVRIAELEAQLSRRSAKEGGGDVGRERERERGDRETTQTPIPTQQAPTSVEPESEQATLIKSQANIIANQRSTLRRIMADINQELHPESEATIDSTHTNEANERAASQHPTADISLLDNIPQQQLDTNTSDPAVSKSQESRMSLLADSTITDAYNVLRKQCGPDACIEITTLHDSGPAMTDGVEGGNVGAEGPRGGLMIDGYPVKGIPGFLKTRPEHTSEPTPIQDTTLANLQNEHAQLQERYDDLQVRYDAAIANEEAIRQDRYDNHLHYLHLLEKGKNKQDDMRREGKALLNLLPDNLKDDAATTVKRSISSFDRYWDCHFQQLLGSPDCEAEDLGRKHSFHEGRIQDLSTDTLLAQCKQVEGSYMVRFLPSRQDQTIFPSTWAWLDQEFARWPYGNDSHRLWERMDRSLHGQWPEVKLAAFSRAFYKLLDSDWGNEAEPMVMAREADTREDPQWLTLMITACLPLEIRDRYEFIR